MKIFRDAIIIVFVALGMAIAPNIYAADTGNAAGNQSADVQNRQKDMEQRRQNIMDQLNLSPEQKKQLENNRTKDRKDMQPLFERMRDYRTSLKEELMKPKLDMDKINDIQAKIKYLQNETTDKRLNSIIGVRKIMTQEQFNKFIELTDQNKAAGAKLETGSRK